MGRLAGRGGRARARAALRQSAARAARSGRERATRSAAISVGDEAQARPSSGFVPVWLGADEVERYYSGYSNSSLWPLLHWMTPYARFSGSWYDAYRAVNERFAATLLETCRDGDLVWVHDYRLLLVPRPRDEAQALSPPLRCTTTTCCSCRACCATSRARAGCAGCASASSCTCRGRATR